ncbi:MAG: phosphatidate cytidylyltransferase [Treponema sp.]|nr:phosphatidate cytidylyltransferase [Treponema sp.]
MKKLAQRLLVFLIGIPLIVILVLFLPYYHNLALNVVIIIFTAIGAVEFSTMLEKKHLKISRIEAAILGALAPAVETLSLVFNCSRLSVPFFLMAGLFWVLLSRIFSRLDAIENFAGRLAAGSSVLIYPGVFLFWLVRMSEWKNSGIIILIFLLVTIGSDSAAWLAGILFGKRNRGIVPVSPNKSIAGFIGGIFGSILISCGAYFIVPSVFIMRGEILPGTAAAVFLGLCTGIAGALGDLCESAIKRSCGFKDSGNIMLGRGGVLDSIDSIAVAAPVFYLLYSLLFINF